MLAYSRLYNILKEKILNKEYTTGEKFPTEKELCEQYDVSRITCRHALRLLQEEGFINRSPGKGTFVRPVQTKKVPILNYDYTRSIQHEAPEITRKLITKRTITPPEYIAEMLGSFRSEDCFFLERIDYLHDEPIAFDKAYIPVNLFRNLTDEMLARVDFLEVDRDISKDIKAVVSLMQTDTFMQAVEEAVDGLKGCE